MTDKEAFGIAVKATIEGTLAPFANLLSALAGPAITSVGRGLGEAVDQYRAKRSIRFMSTFKRMIDDAGIDARPVPPKILLGVLQAASIEDDDSLQDRWAALLANASNHSPDDPYVLPSFPAILSDLSSTDARFLDALVTSLANSHSGRLPFSVNNLWDFPIKHPQVEFANIFATAGLGTVDPSLTYTHGTPASLESAVERDKRVLSISLSNLERLNLVEKEATTDGRIGDAWKPRLRIQQEFTYYLTPIGFLFVHACRPPTATKKTESSEIGSHQP